MSEKTAQFRFEKFTILRSLIEIDDKKTISDKISVEFKQTSGINVSELKFKNTLEVSITDENDSLKIHVIAVGFFDFDSDLEKTKQDVFFSQNAPAILFPYVRAYITTLTSLSGIKPIILPTLNLSNR